MSDNTYLKKDHLNDQDLMQLGLKEKEAKVFLALLTHAAQYPAELVRFTGLNRVTCYDVLESLIKKKLIAKIKRNNRFLFQITDPRALREKIARAKYTAEQQLNFFDLCLPTFNHLLRCGHDTPRVIYFEGQEGIEKFFKDNWNFNTHPVVGYTNLVSLSAALGPSVLRNLVKEKIKHKIVARYLTPFGHAQAIEKWQRLFYPIASSYRPKFRIVNDPKIQFANHIKIYANRLAILDLRDIKTSQGIIIENQQIADTARNIFQLAWKGAKYRI